MIIFRTGLSPTQRFSRTRRRLTPVRVPDYSEYIHAAISGNVKLNIDQKNNNLERMITMIDQESGFTGGR